MERLLWICAGGAVGSGARYLVTEQVERWFGTALPWGTFAVNALGSFALAALLTVFLASDHLSPNLRMALTTGAMGGFTTYSTFSHDTFRYLHEGAWGLAAANVALTVLVCLGACFLGFALGRSLVG